jgi:hypothetical protein
MTRRVAALVVGAAVAVACTGQRATSPPSPSPASTASPPSAAIEVPLVVDRDGGGYLDGIELALGQVNAAGGVDGLLLRLVTVNGFRTLPDPDVPAAILVGGGSRVVRSRPLIEEAGDPVIVLGDDLYSPLRLYRQVFQASVPDLWQARALARLLVRDLRMRDVRMMPTDRDTRAAYEAAFAEEGAMLGAARDVQAASGAEALVVPGSADEVASVVERNAAVRDPPLVALSAEGLGVESDLPPGTVAPYHYAWSGWAEAISRVDRFRRRFERVHGRPPEALQQEGYDAVRILAEALEATEGRGGEALIRALESVRDRAYSSLPLRLGPDDHVLHSEGQLGLFAVARPGTRAPGEALGSNPWRPVMRTFTYNGERVTIVRRDIPEFFPRWSYPAPTPEYQRSRYGITSPAGTPPR